MDLSTMTVLLGVISSTMFIVAIFAMIGKMKTNKVKTIKPVYHDVTRKPTRAKVLPKTDTKTSV